MGSAHLILTASGHGKISGVLPCRLHPRRQGQLSGQVSWLANLPPGQTFPASGRSELFQLARGQWLAPPAGGGTAHWGCRSGSLRLQWRGPRRFFTGFPLSAVALQRERRHLESTYVIPCPGRMKAISGFWIDQPDPQLSPSRIHLDARRKPLELNDLSDEGWSWRRSKELAEVRLDLVQKLSA